MFPSAVRRAKRRVADTFGDRPVALRLLCWIAAVEATFPYVWLRSIADNAGMPREGAALRLDRLIGLGMTPTERLQDLFYSGSAQPFDWAMGLLHLSWFLVPEAVTLYVLVFRWDLFPQLAALRLGVLYAGLIGFFLLPTEPPWMAVHVVRILDVVNGEPLKIDPNALAALPSLHVAIPTALALWLWRVRLPRWALVYTVWAAAMTFAVVYLGEHYLVDALAGMALAYLVMRLVVRVVPSGARPMSAASTGSGGGAAGTMTSPRAG